MGYAKIFMSLVANFAFSNFFLDNLHTSFIPVYITLEIFKIRHKKHEENLRKRIWRKFCLGSKNLGSDTDTET